MTYGYTVQEGRDPFVDLAEKVMDMLSLVATPGAFLVDLIPACKAKLKHPLAQKHSEAIYSTISPGMVPWYGFLAGCKEIPSIFDGVGSEASPICRGANGRIFIVFILKGAHLTLHEAAGTAIPSFSSTLLEGGVSAEEEDLIMWTSMNVYLGMFCSQSYLSRLDVFS